MSDQAWKLYIKLIVNGLIINGLNINGLTYIGLKIEAWQPIGSLNWSPTLSFQ